MYMQQNKYLMIALVFLTYCIPAKAAHAGAGAGDNETITSPLHIAAAKGDLDSVKKLLAAKANPNATDCEITPLMAAIKNAHTSGHVECVKLLLAAKADPNHKTKDGQTVLHIGARSTMGYRDYLAEALGILVQNKADANLGATDLGTEPVIYAAVSRFPKAVNILARHSSHGALLMASSTLHDLAQRAVRQEATDLLDKNELSQTRQALNRALQAHEDMSLTLATRQAKRADTLRLYKLSKNQVDNAADAA